MRHRTNVNCKTKMEQKTEVLDEDSELLVQNYQKNAKLNKRKTYRKRLLNKLLLYQSMQDEHPKHMSAAKLHIELLNPTKQPVNLEKNALDQRNSLLKQWKSIVCSRRRLSSFCKQNGRPSSSLQLRRTDRYIFAFNTANKTP